MSLNPPDGEQGANRPRAKGEPTVSLALLVVITAIPAVTINIYLPSMPGIVTHFQTDIQTIQYALSLYLLGLAMGQLAYGPISDRLGRRPVLLVGIALYCIGSLLCALAQGIEMFLIGRLLQASGGAAGMVLGRAMVRDVHDNARVASVLGYTVMITTIATAIAPIIGGTLDELFDWRAPFFLLTAVGLTVLVSCFIWAKETATLSGAASGHVWSGYTEVLKHRSFWRFMLYSSLIIASYFTFIAGAPVVVIELWKFSPTSFGAYWMIGSLSYFIGSFMAGRFSERFGTDGMLRIGTPILLVGALALMLMLAIGPHHPLALFILGLTFIGSGVMQPSIMSSAINVDLGNIGSASGLLGCTQILFGVLAISLLGLFPTDEQIYFGMVCSGAIVLGVFFSVILRR